LPGDKTKIKQKSSENAKVLSLFSLFFLELEITAYPKTL